MLAKFLEKVLIYLRYCSYGVASHHKPVQHLQTVCKVQNAKKGDFARHRLKGKRAIELGSGMGLGGFAFALLGCDTTVTDTAEVVCLLQRNYENNLSPAALTGGSAASGSVFKSSSYIMQALHTVCRAGLEVSNMVGHVTVQELDWSIPDHYSAVIPPFDYVLAADCVYHEHIIEDLLRTVLAVTHNKSIGRFWNLLSCLEPCSHLPHVV